MNTFDLIRQLILNTIDFLDDLMEAKFEAVVTAAGVAMGNAQLIDLVKGDEDPTDQLEGLTTLARVTGQANLSGTDLDALKGSIGKIVKNPDNPALESALEGAFFSILDLQVACKDLNTYIASQVGAGGGE